MRDWIWIGLIFFNLAPVKAEHLETRRNVGIKSAPSKEADEDQSEISIELPKGVYAGSSIGFKIETLP